ncbi:MAG: hypothetical protein EZS28_015484, partial [Streblomastix strix]
QTRKRTKTKRHRRFTVQRKGPTSALKLKQKTALNANLALNVDTIDNNDNQPRIDAHTHKYLQPNKDSKSEDDWLSGPEDEDKSGERKSQLNLEESNIGQVNGNNINDKIKLSHMKQNNLSSKNEFSGKQNKTKNQSHSSSNGRNQNKPKKQNISSNQGSNKLLRNNKSNVQNFDYYPNYPQLGQYITQGIGVPKSARLRNRQNGVDNNQIQSETKKGNDEGIHRIKDTIIDTKISNQLPMRSLRRQSYLGSSNPNEDIQRASDISNEQQIDVMSTGDSNEMRINIAMKRQRNQNKDETEIIGLPQNEQQMNKGIQKRRSKISNKGQVSGKEEETDTFTDNELENIINKHDGDKGNKRRRVDESGDQESSSESILPSVPLDHDH